MSESILIVVSDGFGGYGDFLFSLKLAEQIRKYYVYLCDNENDIPEIKLVTQETGKQKIKSLKGDIEFGVDVITPMDLEGLIDNGLKIISVIEGPVFKSRLINDIDGALKDHAAVPLIMIPEYAYSDPLSRKHIDNERKYRKLFLEKIIYRETIYTGFNSNAHEKGIILSDRLINFEEPSVLRTQLDPEIEWSLIGNIDIETYFSNTDLYFQYSHDIYLTNPDIPAATRFLNIHRIYANNSEKNQDILMVGRAESKKREALLQVKSQLIKDGFAKISFYNIDTEDEEYFYGDADAEGRHYRIIYTSVMSHNSMIAAQALSCDLVGVTGDQSFGEGVSADKVLIYECLPHKEILCKGYYNRLETIDPECTKVLNLLKNANKESEYKDLEILLTPLMKSKLKSLSRQFRQESGELVKFSTIASMSTNLLIRKIKDNNIFPYNNDNEGLASPFEIILREGQYDIIPHIIHNYTSKLNDKKKFCQVLMLKNEAGKSFFEIMLRKGRYDLIADILHNYIPESNDKKQFFEALMLKNEEDESFFETMLREGRYDLIADILHNYIPESNDKKQFFEALMLKNEEDESFFETMLREGRYDLIADILHNYIPESNDKKQFFEALMLKNHEGKSFLSLLSEARTHEEGISKARYLVIRFNLKKYESRQNTKRANMVNALNEFISTFNALQKGSDEEQALIGLMLLIAKNISKEYLFFSPKKGKSFGSQLYSNIQMTLKELSINLDIIHSKKRQDYYRNLAKYIKNNPRLLTNNYIIDSLKKEAGILLQENLDQRYTNTYQEKPTLRMRMRP